LIQSIVVIRLGRAVVLPALAAAGVMMMFGLIVLVAVKFDLAEVCNN
jgi:hypothetical protein